MDNTVASYILSCYTNAQLAAVHDHFKIELDPKGKHGGVVITGQRATLYYKDQTHIRSLSIHRLVLRSGGSMSLYTSPCGHVSGNENMAGHCGWFPCKPCNKAHSHKAH